MKIPKYWSKARYPGGDSRNTAIACGWSFSSLEDAKKQAATRAKRIFELVSRGQKPNTYEYSDRPVKEEIIREISDGKEQVAVITRNRYGALVLNSAKTLFADVDYPAAGSGGFIEGLISMFMTKKREERRRAQIQETTRRIEQWAESNPSRGYRMYRTQQGLRLLFTDKLYDPTSEETLGILRGLNADPMYITLTQKQECFRARLTAKPWRCGCPRPPSSYPWENAESERAFRHWEKQYAGAEAKFRACEFIAAHGNAAGIPALQAVVAAHDQGARIESSAPLA